MYACGGLLLKFVDAYSEKSWCTATTLFYSHYGFWLPNDPRGSWSEFVASWEIARFGETTRHLEQRPLAMLSADEVALREAARQAFLYPPVALSGDQALSIANGFKAQATKSDYAIWACSILPEHTHPVIARHCYKAEQIANLLKGAATRRLIADGIHPLHKKTTRRVSANKVLNTFRHQRINHDKWTDRYCRRLSCAQRLSASTDKSPARADAVIGSVTVCSTPFGING